MKKNTWILIAFLIGIIGGGLLYRHFAQERDSRGATRLMRALEENDTEKMQKLLNEAEINARDKSGQTPLFYAARHAQQPQIIHKLLLAGADNLATDKQGHTPLMNAARYNPNPAVTLVLARQGGLTPEQIRNKNEALFLAARHNTAAVIKMLLIAQASPSVTDRHHRHATDYLEQNEQLSQQEKTDLRQVMMLLEILEGREQFSATVKREPTLRQMDSVANKETAHPATTPQQPADTAA